MIPPESDRMAGGDLRAPSESPPPASAPGGRVPPPDEAPGLPGIGRWRTVYWIVFGIFVLWVSLLTWFTAAYS